jgi:hypothetical protein
MVGLGEGVMIRGDGDGDDNGDGDEKGDGDEERGRAV